MVTHWKIDLTHLSHSDDAGAQKGRRLFEAGKANTEDPEELVALAPEGMTDERDKLAWAVGTNLSRESAWSVYGNAGWCASAGVDRQFLERLADAYPTLVINCPGVPPQLIDRAARHLLAAAKFVRVQRLIELGEEPTDVERKILSGFDANQPWFADPNPLRNSATGYVLNFSPRAEPAELRRHNRAIDEFLHPTGLPTGYVARVIQLEQGLIARAFVPEGAHGRLNRGWKVTTRLCRGVQAASTARCAWSRDLSVSPMEAVVWISPPRAFLSFCVAGAVKAWWSKPYRCGVSIPGSWRRWVCR